MLDLAGVAAELLAESNRRGILEMSPANLQDFAKFLGFLQQRRV